MSIYKLQAVCMVVLGFLINFSQECSSGQYPCILNSTQGSIASPGYPSFYPNNINISWLIQVLHGYSIKLEFSNNFQIELKQTCQSDYLVIYDGPSTGSPVMGKYCGSDKPSNLYSSGSVLLVGFISNDEYQSSGFSANYTAIKSASNCSAQQTEEENANLILKEASGNIFAYFNNTYHKMNPVSCLWRLQAPQGYGIKIIINALNIYQNTSCFQNNFDIYKGYVVQEDKLVSRYCTVGNPIVKYIPNRRAVIRLQMNEQSSWNGSEDFSVKYEYIKKDKNECSTLNNDQENLNIVLTGSNGSFTIRHTDTPGSANPEQSLQCQWKIKAPTGQQIRLNFTEFESDCGVSFVEILDGEHSKGKFCGSVTPWVVFSTDGYLVVKFVASGSMRNLSRLSLVGVYEAVMYAKGRCSTINTNEMNSNIQLKDPKGIVMTPNYPSKYPADFKCIWIITVPQGYRIRLHFVAFKMENHGCIYDFVEVRDGNSRSSPLKTQGNLCGSMIPYDIYSTANNMWITFESDYSEQMTGFQAFYSAVTPEPGKCSPANTDQENKNIVINKIPGVLTTPNYPLPYPPNIKCSWRISVPRSSRIHVHFEDFKLHSPCSFEFLEGFDGVAISGRSLGRYCGNSLPFDLFSTGNSITLFFQSTKSAGNRGFKMSYSILQLGPGICSKAKPQFLNDNLVANDTSGYITSPNYPLPYTRGMQCTWHVQAPLGYHVELNFTSIHFPLPCVQDYIEVRDGSSSYSPVKGRFCNLQSAFRIYSSGRELWLRFVSQRTASEAYKGFYVKYRMIKAGNCSVDFDQSWNMNLIFSESSSGILTSPGYPASFPPDIKCTWKITVPYGYRVQLIFNHIILRESCKSDYVEVRDGYYSFSKSLGKFCKTEVSSIRVLSTDRRILVHFESGKISMLGKGFDATFSAMMKATTSSASFTAGAITVSLIVFAGFVVITLAFIFVYWLLRKRYHRRSSSRPRDHDLGVIPPMPVPPLDDIPDCLIAEDRPPSYADAINQDHEQEQPVRENGRENSGFTDESRTVEERPREAERGLDNEGFTNDPPTYESLYGVDPT